MIAGVDENDLMNEADDAGRKECEVVVRKMDRANIARRNLWLYVRTTSLVFGIVAEAAVCSLQFKVQAQVKCDLTRVKLPLGCYLLLISGLEWQSSGIVQ